MKTILSRLALSMAVSLTMIGAAAAASVTNQDAQAQVLMVTENGDTIEVVVEAGATVNFCPAGCFVTMPSGDRETLAGGETIDILNGSAVIK